MNDRVQNIGMYNANLGRWLSPDPYGQFHSPYLAMSNNPVSFTDPTGGFSETGPTYYVDGMRVSASYASFYVKANIASGNLEINGSGLKGGQSVGEYLGLDLKYKWKQTQLYEYLDESGMKSFLKSTNGNLISTGVRATKISYLETSSPGISNVSNMRSLGYSEKDIEKYGELSGVLKRGVDGMIKRGIYSPIYQKGAYKDFGKYKPKSKFMKEVDFMVNSSMAVAFAPAVASAILPALGSPLLSFLTKYPTIAFGIGNGSTNFASQLYINGGDYKKVNYTSVFANSFIYNPLLASGISSGLAFTGEGYNGFGKRDTKLILFEIGIGAAGNYGIGKSQGLFGAQTSPLRSMFMGAVGSGGFNFLGTTIPASVEKFHK